MRTKEQILAEFDSLFSPTGALSYTNQAKAYSLLAEYQEAKKMDKTDLSVRGEMLDEAKGLVTGDRNAVYGPPNQDFQRTADMASAWGFQVDGKPLQSHHVAIFVDIIKTSRLKWTPTKRDSWVDKAGYAACGLECALIDAGPQMQPKHEEWCGDPALSRPADRCTCDITPAQQARDNKPKRYRIWRRK